MKAFISWSGETSKGVGEILTKWLPCIIQSIEIFFSPEDIEKGENWQSRLTKELGVCNFGIIILTSENINSPWINFEAGAIAKSLDSKIATLLVDVNPSNIKGPFSKFQGTLLTKEDIFRLVKSINQEQEKTLDDAKLKQTFDAMWPQVDIELKGLKPVQNASEKPPTSGKAKAKDVDTTLEEILQLLRNQSVLLLSPEQLLPVAYFDKLMSKHYQGHDSKGLLEYISKKLFEVAEGMLSQNQNDISINSQSYSEYLSSIIQLLTILAHESDSQEILNRVELLTNMMRRGRNIHLKRSLVKSSNPAQLTDLVP